MKYVLIYWQPKDIPEVLESIDNLDIDKLILKYYKYPDVHKRTDYFVKKYLIDEYDYVIMITNDVIVKQENLDQLISDVEETNYKVISAVMNVDLKTEKDVINITLEMPQKGKPYKWVERGELKGINKVKFAGFPLMAIHTSLLKTRKFDGNMTQATDVRFCKSLEEDGIPIYANCDNEMLHLRYVGEMLAGFKTPETWFKGKKYNG